ncbi:MAG: DUF6171 family protein [Lachnospiraceae bacterium]|nr:DUF6171 family protein [Lachnospiraceae bacterium]
MKPCVKCLLQEYDEEKYRQLIANEIEWMDAEMKTPDEEYERRLDICRKCEKLSAGTCLKCGCFVELRAAAKAGHCPGKQW